MMAAADKSAIRRELRARRSAFVAALGAHRDKAEAALSRRVTEQFGQHQIIAGYLAIGAEVDVARILDAAERAGISTTLPHVTARGEPMRFLRWQPGEPLHAGPYGLLQPADAGDSIRPDLILAPLVGFDRSGGRLGQGAGFYDRVFAADPAARRIGIAWSVQEMPALPLDAWDMPLHAVATEREWIEINPDRAGASPSASS